MPFAASLLRKRLCRSRVRKSGIGRVVPIRSKFALCQGPQKQRDGQENDLLQDRQGRPGDQEQGWQAVQGVGPHPVADRWQIDRGGTHCEIQNGGRRHHPLPEATGGFRLYQGICQSLRRIFQRPTCRHLIRRRSRLHQHAGPGQARLPELAVRLARARAGRSCQGRSRSQAEARGRRAQKETRG